MRLGHLLLFFIGVFINTQLKAQEKIYTSLTDALKNKSVVKILHLKNQNLTKLSADISLLKNLEEIDLSGNKFTEFPKALYGCLHLKKIVLKGTKISAIPDNIDTFSQLICLQITQNINENWINETDTLKMIPAALFNIPTLRIIEVNNLGYALFPDTINYNSLREVYFNYNLIRTIPAVFFKNDSLLILDLSNNLITNIDSNIAQTKSLKMLDLNGNKLNELPKEIASLSNLSYLNLAANHLQNPDIAIADIIRLTALRYLNLSAVDIAKLPDNFGNLVNLEEAVLSYNKLKVLPESFSKLNKLQRLNLSRNNLQQLSPSFALKNIRHLDLSYNNLSEFSFPLCTFISLESIDLSFNKEMNKYNDAIKQLENVKIVNLKNTKFTPIQIDKMLQLIPCNFIY